MGGEGVFDRALDFLARLRADDLARLQVDEERGLGKVLAPHRTKAIGGGVPPPDRDHSGQEVAVVQASVAPRNGRAHLGFGFEGVGRQRGVVGERGRLRPEAAFDGPAPAQRLEGPTGVVLVGAQGVPHRLLDLQSLLRAEEPVLFEPQGEGHARGRLSGRDAHVIRRCEPELDGEDTDQQFLSFQHPLRRIAGGCWTE